MNFKTEKNMSQVNIREILGDGQPCEGLEAAWYDEITVNFQREDSENGTGAGDGLGTVYVNFRVPEKHVATITVENFAVDDWGHLSIYKMGETEKLLHLGMDAGIDGEPGERGGHEEWAKSGSVRLIPGDYIIEINQENVNYIKGDSRFNVSKCKLSLAATKEEAECQIPWPTTPIALGNPITWYETNTRSDLVKRRWNTGTIDSISPESFMQMVKIIYAEAAPAGTYTQEEMQGIASVMLNRMGNSKIASYKVNTVITDITSEFSDSNNWESIIGPLYPPIANTSAYELTGASCKKLLDALKALLSVLQKGAIFEWDRFVAATASHRADTTNYVVYGGTAFNKKKVYYYDSRTKPSGWDSMDIDKNGPLAGRATERDTVS